MSYIEFFEFKEHPFRITPDVAFFFSSETHVEALESMKYFAGSDEGFFVMVGEPGTGKTITTRKFLNEIPENTEYAYILFPSLEPEDMFRAVLEDFGYEIDGNVSKNTLFSGFRDFLTKKKEEGKRILLVIDEAQNLPPATLEELRILSNLETEKEKLIQFILCGQPELETKLDSEKLRQLKQRISLQANLNYLSQEEAERYISFRLSKAGYSGIYPDKSFYKKLHKTTEGNPRLLNLVMERSLMAAFVQQSRSVDTQHLKSAAASLNLIKKESPLVKLSVAALLIFALIFAGWAYIKNQQTKEIAHTPELVQEIIEETTRTEPKETVRKTPEPEGIPAYVIVDNLNLRNKPTVNSDVIIKLNKSHKVQIISDQGDWVRVIHTVDHDIYDGWLYRKFIRLETPQ